MTVLDTRLFGFLATLWGGILIYFYHSLRIQKYLAPDFHLIVLIGGVGIILLGLYSLINPREDDETSSPHDHDCSDCHHEHDGHGPLVTYSLTLLPLIGALFLTQDKLSEQGIARKSRASKETLAKLAPAPAFTREDLESRVSKNTEGEFELSLVTVAWVAGDREVEPVFDGLPVELAGRLGALNKNNGKRRRIYRSIISCCAADMAIADVALDFPEEPSALPDGEWVKAAGILTFETIGSDRLPLLKVRQVSPTEEPYSEYLLRQ